MEVGRHALGLDELLMNVLVRRFGFTYGLFASAAAFGVAHVGVYGPTADLRGGRVVRLRARLAAGALGPDERGGPR